VFVTLLKMQIANTIFACF